MSEKEETLDEQMIRAHRRARGIRDQLNRLLRGESLEDLRNNHYGSDYDMVEVEIRRRWKEIVGPVIEALQTDLAKAEREYHELVRRVARGLP